MKKTIKIICLTLCLTLAFLTPLSDSTASVSAAGNADEYTVYYCLTDPLPGQAWIRNITVKLSEDWFGSSSYGYNSELCKTSSVLSSCAYSSWTLEDAMGRMGFANRYFSKEYSNSDYNEDGIRCALGSKKLTLNGEEYTLVLVGLGGTNGEEWLGNFNIGTGDYHQSFLSAANGVMTLIDSYTSKLDRRNGFKFWIVGHSRGAAVANLVAAKLDESAVLAQPSDIFAYTYATPNVTTRDNTQSELYLNIFNVVNPEDFVTYAPPPQWGYWKYGRVFSLPTVVEGSKKSVYADELLSCFSRLTGGSTYDYYENGPETTRNMIRMVNYASQGSISGFINKEYNLGDLIPQNLREKYNLNSTITPSGFFKTVGELLSGRIDYGAAINKLILSVVHPVFSRIILYFATGIFSPDEAKAMLAEVFESYPQVAEYFTLEELSPLIEESVGSQIMRAHGAESYIAWLQTVPDSSLVPAVNEYRGELAGAVAITDENGFPLASPVAVFTPVYSGYSAQILTLGCSCEGLKSVSWKSSNPLVTVSDGTVRCLASFNQRAKITATVKLVSGETVSDSVTVAFVKFAPGLKNLVPSSFEGKNELLSPTQRKLLCKLASAKLKQIIAKKFKEIFSGAAG